MTLLSSRKRARLAGAALSATLFATVVGVGPAGLEIDSRAEASVSVAMTLDELVDQSSRVVIATADETTSRWEDLPAGRRIVTYTHLTIDETMTGDGKSEIWVRTLGGVVGKIGQQVSGEAQIALHSRSLLFLADVEDGPGNAVTVVAGMAQGHFPLDESGSEPKLKPSPDRGGILPRRGPSIPASEELIGKTLSDARTRITAAATRNSKP